ncbi:MAG: FliH/SctL family protein [Pirellulaceae bacterium]|nr:FliH/SctL family protein [Pirellulaceae bacterium]
MATVLKQKQFLDGVNTAKAEVFNWEDVAARARTYLASVREQADEILRKAVEDARSVKTLAQEQGRTAGQSDIVATAETMASKIANQRISNATQSIHALADELEAATQHWLRQWQHETVPLAVSIAERLVHRQIEIDPTILLQWLQDSVRMVQGGQTVQLRMNPSDIKTLGPALPKLLEELKSRLAIELIEDSSIALHGLVLRSSELMIDQQLRTQLDRLQEELQ